ncbi:MAG: DUF4440 domain-containing protein [Phycisphaerae bacterium]|nr:DUF4440 domain-containing protein [Phycisphaerae bacterium]
MLAKKYFLVGIFTLLSVSLAIAAPPAVHPTTGEPLVIDCLRGTPDAIDGDLSDWNLGAMTPAILDMEEQIPQGAATWDGPEDSSGEFYLLWDDENIYIAVVMKDEKLSMNKTGGNIWNADAVEIFFSTTNAVAGHNEHYQYGFNANEQKWNWDDMEGSGGAVDYLQIASTETADGYVCEVSIPYGEITPLDWSVGSTIGFNAVFDDTDNDNRELQMTWTGRTAHDQSLGFGHMVLSDDPVSADVAAIEELLDLYAVAMNTGDLELWLSLHTDDIVKMPPDAPASFGQEQLRANLEPLFDNFTFEMAIYTVETQVDGDLGYSWCFYTSLMTPKAGGEPIFTDGKALSILKRQPDGSWKLSHDCFNSNVPPAPVE